MSGDGLCADCEGRGWTAEHACGGDERVCPEVCPVQEQCRTCTGTGAAPSPSIPDPSDEREETLPEQLRRIAAELRSVAPQLLSRSAARSTIDAADLLDALAAAAARPTSLPEAPEPDESFETSVEYGRRFDDGEVFPSQMGYTDDPRWLTLNGQRVTWVQRTVVIRRSSWTSAATPSAPPVAVDPEAGARPSWVTDDAEMPSADRHLPSECFVAGALSTMEPFRNLHPAWCLPFARQALDALGEWDPDDCPPAPASGGDGEGTGNDG